MSTLSSSRQVRVTLVMVLVLMVPATAFYLRYTGDHRAFLTSRDFRRLSVISRQVSSRIATLESTIDSVVVSADHGNAPVPSKDAGEEGKAGSTPIPAAVTAAGPGGSGPTSGDIKQVEKPASEQAQTGRVQLVSEAFDKAEKDLVPRLRLVAEPQISEGGQAGPSVPKFKLTISQPRSEVWLHITYDGRPERSSRSYHIEAAVSLNELVGQYVNLTGQSGADEFDGVLVVLRGSGRVVFQRDRPGLSANSLGTLLGVGKDPAIAFGSVDGYSGLKDITAGGDPYKLFIQPVELLLTTEEGKADDLVVCGLISTEQFDEEARSISPTVLIVILFLFLMAVLGLPFIQLGLMGPGNRLRVGDVLFGGLATLVGAGLLTFAVLDIYSYSRLEARLDGQLSQMSYQVSSGLLSELSTAVNQLDDLRDPPLAASIGVLQKEDAARKAPRFLGRASILGSGKQANTANPPSPSPDLAPLSARAIRYPYFDTAFWADSEGWQRIKVTTDSYISPFVRVNNRPYFQNALQGKLWRVSTADSAFFPDSVSAVNSGKNLAVISTPLYYPNPDANWVGVISTRLLSLTDTVFPDGFGFCVINKDGDVLFHSDENRDLEENVFDECDQGASLRAAVNDGAATYINTRYTGKPHRMYVRPIAGLPWSLIVFRDKDILASANLEMLTVSGTLLLIYSILLGTFLYIACPLHSKKRSAWIWPYRRQPQKYAAMAAVFLAFDVLLYLVIINGSGWFLILPAFLIPLVGVAASYLILSKNWLAPVFTRVDSKGRLRKLSMLFDYRTGYALSGALLLLLFAVLPAIAWFKAAHDREMRLLVRFGQISIAKRLDQRSSALRRTYQALAGGQTDPAVSHWGNYYSFFFGTTASTHLAGQAATVAEETLLEKFMGFIYPSFSHSLYFQGIQGNLAADDPDGDGDVELELTAAKEGDPDSAIDLNSKVPVLGAPDDAVGKVLWFGGVALFPVVMVLGLYFVARTISRSVFLIDLSESHCAESASAEDFKKVDRNLLVLAGSAARRARLGNLDGVKVISIAGYGDQSKWAESFEYDALVASKIKLLAIDNFEYKMDDPVHNENKLVFLRQLWARGIKTVVLSEVNPAYFQLNGATLVENGDPANTGHRSGISRAEWAEAFSSFLKVHIDPVVLGGLEPGTAFHSGMGQDSPNRHASGLDEKSIQRGIAWLARQILEVDATERVVRPIVDLSALDYGSIWLTLSRDERLTLFYIAHDRFASCKNPVVQDLLKRGLVKRDPALNPMTPKFRRFIISAIKPEEM
ncbi:MAG TPA: cache domain-containing protein, partial [Blastocatellia bacterium]|nr:cache domain-containing protein [Blastocatellia bacterium]